MYQDKIKKQKLTKIKTVKEEKAVIQALEGQNDEPDSFRKNQGRKALDPNLYHYKNMNNQTCFYIRRIEDRFGKKIFTPLSLWKDDNGFYEWKQKAWSENRPLFREENLSRSFKPVLIVEGEKACIHAEKEPALKDKYICVSYSGGAKAVPYTLFNSLKDREVILMPDNDKPGAEAMHEIAKRLIDEEITDKIKWVTYAGKRLPDKWDVADPLPQGHTVESIVSDQIDYDETDFEKHWKKIEKRWNEKKIKAVVEELMNRYVFVESLNMFFDKKLFKNIELRNVANNYLHITKKSSITMDKQLLMEAGFPKVVSYFTHPGLPPGVITLKDNQILDLAGGKYLNNFRPHNLEPVKGKTGYIETVIKFFKYLLGEENWYIVEQFLAFLVQKPGVKAHWVIFIQSTEGGGKGLLGQIIQAIIGTANAYINVKAHQLTEKHSTLIQGRQLIVLNELSFSSSTKDKAELTNELKDLFTEHEIIINQKNKDPIRTANFCNFLIFTNDSRALKLDKNSRRYAIMRVQHEQEDIVQKQNELDVVNIILDLIENDPGTLLHYFKNEVELEDNRYFTGHAPRTADFDSMVEDTKDECEQFLDEALEAGTWPFNSEIIYGDRFTPKYNGFSGLVHLEELYEKLKKEKSFFINRAKLTDFLKSNCIKWADGSWTRQVKLSNKSRPKMWLLKDFAANSGGKSYKDCTETELGEIHEKFGFVQRGSEYFTPFDYFQEMYGHNQFDGKGKKQLDIAAVINEFKKKDISLGEEEAERIIVARKQEEYALNQARKREADKVIAEAKKEAAQS